MTLILTMLLGSVAAMAAEQADTGSDEAPKLEGIAVNHLGGGISDVQVIVYRDGRKIGETRTGPTGEFSLDPAIKEKCRLVVEMLRAGYAPFKTEVEFDPESPPYVDTELAGSLVVEGKVVGLPGDTPVAGASVRLTVPYKNIEGKTGADGTFRLEGCPPEQARLEVEADGFGRHQQDVIAARTDTPLTIRLKKERLIEITVLDDRDKPVAGAAVELRTTIGENSDLQTQRTDQHGRTTFRKVHFDTEDARARVLHPDHVQIKEFNNVVKLEKDKVNTPVTFVLPRAAKIAGRITDATTGNPLHSARVIAGTPGQGFVPQDFTDQNGEYSLSGLSPGKVPVTVHRADYAPALVEVTGQVGQTVRADVKLSAGASLAGMVEGPDGRPLSGCIVASTLWKGYDTLSLKALTDENGRFEFENVPADEILFAVLTPEGAPIKKDLKLEAGKTDHRIKVDAIEAPPAIAGAFRSGEPVPDVKVVTLDGREIDLAGLGGKYLFIDFWATWCGPCVGELPNLQALQRAVKDRTDVVILSISLDRNEQALRAFLEKNHMPWLHVFGEKGNAPAAADAFHVSSIPASFLVGPDGRILAANLRGPALARQVLDILSARPSDTKAPPVIR